MSAPILATKLFIPPRRPMVVPRPHLLTRLHDGLHRKLTKPYRRLRRAFLRKQHETGALQSPTADLEDHYQPEKETWRKTQK